MLHPPPPGPGVELKLPMELLHQDMWVAEPGFDLISLVILHR